MYIRYHSFVSLKYDLFLFVCLLLVRCLIDRRRTGLRLILSFGLAAL